MAAKVVDFPEPVGPVTITRPMGSSTRDSTTGGRPSWANPGISKGMIRRASEHVSRWWKALQRSRARSFQLKAKSISRSAS